MSRGIDSQAAFDLSVPPDTTHCWMYLYFHLTPNTCSATVHPEYQKAEEHSDPHQGDGRRGGEKLAVVDSEVPDDSQYHHKHGHHQAAGADGHACSPESAGAPSPGWSSCPRLSPFLWIVLEQGLGNVAVDHAVVRNV